MVANRNLTEFISKHKEMVEKELEQLMNNLNCPRSSNKRWHILFKLVGKEFDHY